MTRLLLLIVAVVFAVVPAAADAGMVTSVFGQNGRTWRKADQEYVSGYGAGLYDMDADTWTPLATTGFSQDSQSSPWNISGDGNHVVGIAFGYNDSFKGVVAHAAIWDGIDKVNLLPNRQAIEGRACRANAVSYDGSVVVGWQDAWIWTEEGGLEYLQAHVEKKLGHALEDFGIVSVYDMSPNGRYICGYGMKGGDPVAYVFDLHTNSGVEEMECSQVKANIYPNPASDEIHVDLPFDGSEVKTTLTLVDMRGQTMRRLDATSTSNVIDIRDLARGIYVLDVNANGKHKTFKVIVK